MGKGSFFGGKADFWKSLTVGADQMAPQGTNDPDYTQIADDGAGSTGIFAYLFDPDAEQELFFTLTLPENYKPGTPITPTVQALVVTADAGVVVLGLEYAWVNKDGTVGDTTIVTSSFTVTATTTGQMIVEDFAEIVGTGKEPGSKIMARLFRKATDLADTLDADVGILSAGIKHQIDMPGRLLKADL